MTSVNDKVDRTDAGARREQEQPGQDMEKGKVGEVRPAGATEMDMPPEGWTETDQKSDESFPASDPPGTY